MQMICGLLIFQKPVFDRPLAEISPWLDMVTRPRAEVFALLDAQRHRRFIKTHTPLDGLPFHPEVMYVCVGRDPRDVAVSIDHHRGNMNAEALNAARARTLREDGIEDTLPGGPPPRAETPEGRFWQWMDDETPPVSAPSTLLSTLNHYREAWRMQEQPNVALFHYGDLKADLEGEMRRLADWLQMKVADGDWAGFTTAASFESMKSRADDLVPNSDAGFFKETQQFFHSGTGGRWREFFDDEASARYEARIASLASPDLVKWSHNGLRGEGE
jgi:hypothetical protein